MRLLAICMLCPHPWTKMPPPPWELFVIPRPSMPDGLHWKLLGNGLCAVAVLAPQLAAVNRVVPVGKPPKRVESYGFCPWKSTPLDNTVMAAPSRAPISDGSCNISARLPLRLASQPTVASSGNRSTWNCIVDGQVYGLPLLAVSVGDSEGLVVERGEPLTANPTQHLTWHRRV